MRILSIPFAQHFEHFTTSSIVALLFGDATHIAQTFSTRVLAPRSVCSGFAMWVVALALPLSWRAW
jgi:hypothetical protein